MIIHKQKKKDKSLPEEYKSKLSMAKRLYVYLKILNQETFSENKKVLM